MVVLSTVMEKLLEPIVQSLCCNHITTLLFSLRVVMRMNKAIMQIPLKMKNNTEDHCFCALCVQRLK